MKSIYLSGPVELEKIIVFLRGCGKVILDVADGDLVKTAKTIKYFCHENGITFEIVEPDPGIQKKLMILFGVGGASFGYLVAGVPGLILGTAFGVGVGYGLSHIKVSFDLNNSQITLVRG